MSHLLTKKDDFLNEIETWLDKNLSMNEISMRALELYSNRNLPQELDDFIMSLMMLSEPGFEMTSQEIISMIQMLKT